MSTPGGLQDPRRPLIPESEILGGTIDKTREDDLGLSFDHELSLRQGRPPRTVERSSRRTQIKDEESRLERVNEDIILDELDEKLRSAVDLSEMYEPLKECLDVIDLLQIVLGLVEKKQY